ncbi:MAG: hypothetical protein CL931_01300 [Deltaproteobacteria bacterium]|nr:hypothetical protein [Deltaproteobacteria bacterium]
MTEGPASSEASQTTTPERSDLLGRFALCFLLLWIPVYSLASIHGDVFSGLPLVYSALVFAAPAGLLSFALGSAGRRRRAGLLGILVAFFLDLQIPGLGSLLLVFVALALGGLFWVLRENLLRILLPTFATILLSMAVFPGAPALPEDDAHAASPAASPTERGLYVHLLLDELSGPHGLPPDLAAPAAGRTQLIDFMERYGFAIAEESSSTYSSSVDSISDLLNFGTLDPDKPVYTGKHPYLLERNAYFERLGNARGPLRVVQSDYMDFCRGAPTPLASCRTYRHDGLSWLAEEPWTAGQKTKLLLGIYGNRPGWIEFVVKRVRRGRRSLSNQGLTFPTVLDWNGTLAPLNGMQALDRLSEELVAGPADATWFAHLLIPHSPYVFDSRCELRPDPFRWLSNFPRYLRSNDEAGRQTRYAQYTEQLTCTLDRLAHLLDRLDSADRLESATIVIQGDHGTRISLLALRDVDRERSSAQEIHDVYGAIFALRSPAEVDLPSGSQASLPNLLERASRNVMEAAHTDALEAKPVVLSGAAERSSSNADFRR